MSKTEMTSKVRELKELKAMADELAAEITAIEDTIKADMTAQGVEEMTVDVYKVRYKTVKSSRFDTTAFKKANLRTDLKSFRWRMKCESLSFPLTTAMMRRRF